MLTGHSSAVWRGQGKGNSAGGRRSCNRAPSASQRPGTYGLIYTLQASLNWQLAPVESMAWIPAGR